MGLLAVRRVKEGTSAILLQSGLDENWCAVFYEMLHLSAKHSRSINLMGRRPMRDVLGNQIKDQSFRLVHWLSITLFL